MKNVLSVKNAFLVVLVSVWFCSAANAKEVVSATPFVSKTKELPFSVVAPNVGGFTEVGLKNIDHFLESEISKKRLPGAVVGIVRNGKLVYLKAFGVADPETSRPMQTDSIFALASMTKPMVAVGALSLTQQGKLPLFSKVADYYPAIGQMQVAVKKSDGSLTLEPPKKQMTIQDLMRHTSGLTYGGRADTGGSTLQYPAGKELPAMKGASEFIQRISALSLVHQPGTVFEYSESFEMLGAVLEKVSGESLDNYLRRTIWKPIGMDDTGFHVPDMKKNRQVFPFKNNPLDGKPQKIETIEADSTFECGGGCALGTVPDFLRFAQMLINGGEFNGQRVLSPQMVQWMTSNHLTRAIDNRVANVEPHRDGYGFGLGVAVRLEPGLAAVPGNVGEFSWNGSYGTGFFVDPKEKLAVVFGTAAPGDLRKYYREQVQDLVYGALQR